jgi:disease resistance protein RPM1
MFKGGAMPRLEEYEFTVNLLKDFCGSGAPYTVDDLALVHLPSLRIVTVCILEADRVSEEVLRSVREKLEREAAAHPKHPRLEIKLW